MKTLAIFLILILVLCTSCIFNNDSNNDSKLFGVWGRGNTSDLHLRSDYSCYGGNQLQGKYEIHGDEITFIEMNNGEERRRATYKYLLYGDFLTFYEVKTSEQYGKYNEYFYEYKRMR